MMMSDNEEKIYKQLSVPNDDMMKKYHRGDTTMQVCGWCAYAGSGMVYGECLVKGKCALIPLLLEGNVDRLPAVDIKCKSMRRAKQIKKTLKLYKKADTKDRQALRGITQNRRILDKMLENIPADKLGTDEVDLDDEVIWSTECVLVRCLGSADMKDEVLQRMDDWITVFKERCLDRKLLMDELISAKKNLRR